ncbi:MAG: hypothetical protein F6K28_39670 [Microcoleus sp. SIO2G3]|nr:hypothetical protein [Microcoleus sp. SIO2G3]
MIQKKLFFARFSSLFGLLLLGLALWAIRNELREYNVRDVLNSFTALPKHRLALAIALTSLGYLAMTGYDTLAFRYIRHSLTYPKLAFTNFLSSATSNTISFL